MTKGVRRWLALGVTALVLGLIIYLVTRSAEWRDFNWNRVWWALFHAHPGYLAAAVASTCLSYLLRSLRWKYFLEPIKSGSLWGLFVGQVLGFSSIYLVGRVGEVVRPAYIARREHVSFGSQVSILLLERVYDSVAMVLLFVLAFDLEPFHPTTAKGVAVLRRVHEGMHSALAFGVLSVVALILFRLYTEALSARVRRVFSFLPPRLESALERSLVSLAAGLDAIRNWRDLLASLMCTGVLWFLNVTVFWLVFRSLDAGLAKLSWWAAVQVLFSAAVGLSVQLPIVGGGFQLGTVQALQHIFHIRPVAATSAGILAWIVVFVPCLAMGLPLLLWEGLTFRQLGDIAREEKKAAAMETTDH
jgi:uncharacterized membrane protein YbhN (UPF0104 family)